MVPSVSLRRSLRKIPAFRSLSGQELEKILERLICKEYKSGDVLWRANSQIDFLGIIQSGEIAIEYRMNGMIIRSTRQVAGDFVLPRNLDGTNTRSIILARAVTDVRLYVFRTEQIGIMRPAWSDININIHPRSRQNRNSLLSRWWIAFVFVFILFLTWSDVTRLVSGCLYLASIQSTQFGYNDQTSMKLLEYAEIVDSEAVFAHNQEGIIWFEQDNLLLAQASFMQAVNLEQNYGPALNNLTVTQFNTGSIQQLVTIQEAAAQNDPDSAEVHYNLGLVLMKQNDFEKALREFKEASFINVNWALPYEQQGFIYLQTNDYVKAEEAARNALRLNANQKSPHLILAIALYNQDKNQEALKSVESALQIDPGDSVSKFYEARILCNLGEVNKALLILKQLLRSTTDQKQISRILAEINVLQNFIQGAMDKPR